MLWIAIILSLLPATHCVQCISSTGKPVDWFIVYKLPELQNADPILREGYGHLYMDVNNPTWQLSKLSMNDSNHAVPYTLQPIYQNKKSDDFMYVMYNDEDPNKVEPRWFGHSKGVLAFDKTSGFWMVHSTPRFPPFQNQSYEWPHTALPYGQSFLCVSYRYSMLNNISEQIMYNYVQVYDSWAPRSFLSDNPYLERVVKAFQLDKPPWYSVLVLTSMQGTTFTSFAKASKFRQDLYSNLVAPTLKNSLLTETWQHGHHNLTSNCTGMYKVYNVKYINFTRVHEDSISFDNLKDHSKWAISKEGNNWVCIGDINRQKHQEVRGGGTLCIQDKDVWSQFSQSVTDYEKCKRK